MFHAQERAKNLGMDTGIGQLNKRRIENIKNTGMYVKKSPFSANAESCIRD
jgi:hypothetical protein